MPKTDTARGFAGAGGLLLGIALALPAAAGDLTYQPGEQRRLDRDSRQQLEQIQRPPNGFDAPSTPADGQARQQLDRVLSGGQAPEQGRPQGADPDASGSPVDRPARPQLNRTQTGEQARLQERQRTNEIMQQQHRKIAPQPYWRERHEGIVRQRGYETRQQRQLNDFRGQQQRFNWQRR